MKNKENEIPAYPILIDKLDIKDAIVSIDAMGCQTAVAEKIREKEGYYFLAVKENQKMLHNSIIEAFRDNKPFNEAKQLITIC